ncbi:MAG TPA: sigma-70 family RNA polymerase sigma factor [Polyangia bacterium]|nr:sigma-70 family RNA polymerase sigma factor [Polyangia bacterium]
MSLPRPVDSAPDGRTPAVDPVEGDARLVIRAAAGDGQAITVIWSRYHLLVRSVLLSTLGADQEIDDLVQEVFMELLRAVKLVRDGTALPAILSRIAVRRAGMALRRRRVRSVILSLPWIDMPDVPVAPADMDSRLALVALYRLLNKIKPRHRLAFLLFSVQGLDVAEVAGALEISLSAAKRAVSAGRKKVLRMAEREPLLKQFLSAEREGKS